MRSIILLVMLIFICASSLYAAKLEGLVLYLPFDEGSGKTAKDASGNGNDGDLQGKVEWVNGKYGKAVQISDDAPNNMVVVKASGTLDVKDQMTMAAWVNVEAMPDSHNSVMTKAETYMIHTSTWRGQGVEMEPLVWFGGSYGNWQTAASIPIPFKEWHHVTGVFDGKEIRTYIDAKQEGSVARAGTIDVTKADLVIGRDSRGCCNSRKSAQTLDDVLIFNRAITEDEVKLLMKGNFLPVEPRGLLTATWGQIKASF